jgi:hypothetical protein
VSTQINQTNQLRTYLFTLTPIIGAVLSTATQLRLGALPLGIGELILLIWACIFTVHIVRTRQKITPVEALFTTLICFYFTCLLLGWITALTLNHWHGVDGEFHILSAAIFTSSIAVLSLISSTRFSATQYLKRVTLITCIPVTLLILILLLKIKIPGLELFYAQVRYFGWSTNPNQFALLVAPLPFFLIGLIHQSPSIQHKVIYALLLLPVLYSGLIIQGEALYIAWLCGMIILLTPRKITPIALTAIAFAILFIIMTTVINIDLILEKLYYMFIFGDQGNVRLTLWANGIEANIQSPLFGLGPGAYSGISAPFQGSEAHNNFIDLSTNAGIPTALTFISGLLLILYKAMKEKIYWAAAATVVLSIFIFFHIMTRQPIFWCYLIVLIRITFWPAAGKPAGETN